LTQKVVGSDWLKKEERETGTRISKKSWKFVIFNFEKTVQYEGRAQHCKNNLY
jgi:hypothetical protein